MKKLISLALIAGTSSLLLISSGTAKMQSSPLFKGGQGGSNFTIITAQIPNNIQNIAQNITVKVHVKDSRGSGILIAKKGQIYTVLTNAHVVNRDKPFRIETPDGKFYNANLIKKGDSLNGDDLAILQFKSNVNYQVAILGDSTKLTPNQDVYTAGFPYSKEQLKLNSGKISLITENPLVGGYQIGFTNDTEQGMSGGAILNSDGKLIGVIGMGSYAILDDAYNYQNGKKPDQDTLKKLRELRFAVPIATITKIDSQLISLLPKEQPKIQQQNYTGIVGDIDKIAGQITVRIDSKNHGNGSGVIVAKNGNTYYVLTALHVVENEDQYQLTTNDNQKYSLEYKKVKVFEGVDLAVVEFTSNENYQVATLGKYELKDSLVFVSGFPGNLKDRLLTGGVVQKEAQDFAAKDEHSLSTGGYGLLYSNISCGGMSGGAVLDHKGRLVGIHTSAEEESINSNIVNVGQSIGIPISTFINLVERAKIQPQWLKIETNKLSKIDEKDLVSVVEQLFDLKTPSKDDFIEWMNYGNQLWRTSQYEKSVTAYDTAIELIKKQPNYSQGDLARAYYGKGLSLWYLGGNNKNKKAREETYNEAVKTFDLATQNDPGFYQAWRHKGLTFLLLKKYPESLAAYDQAIKINNTDFVLLVERGIVLRELKRYQESIASYDQAIKIKPHPWAYGNMGNTYLELKEYQKAIDNYNKVIEINPDDAMAYLSRGNTYLDLKEYQKALADYNKAIDIKPDFAIAYYNSAIAYYNRGITYYYLKEYQKALADYNKAIEINPDYAIAYFGRGNIYLELKEYQKALDEFNKAIRIDPDFALAYNNRGLTYYYLKEYQKALAEFNKAIEIKPDLAIAYYNRGLTYYELKEYQKALADYNKVIKINPDLADAYFSKGNIYFKLKEYQKAIDNYNKVIKINPDYAEAYYSRGVTYYVLKEYQKALADYNQALAISKDFWPAITNIGLIKYETGDIETAKQYWEKAIKIDNQQAEPQLALAVAIYTQGDKIKGLQLAENALKIDRKFGDIEHLKKNAWQEKMIKDAEILLNEPKIKALLGGKK